MKIEAKFPGFFGRLRLYLFGLGIGCVMLVLFQMGKRQEAARQQADAERATQPAADPLFPTLPESEIRPKSEVPK